MQVEVTGVWAGGAAEDEVGATYSMLESCTLPSETGG